MAAHQDGEVEIVTGAFIVKDGKILLVTGPKFHDKWVVPGGHVEFGEKIRDCTEREAKEEVGLTIKAAELICVTEDLKKMVAGRPRHFIFLNWKCELIAGAPSVDGRELTKMAWIPIKEALQDKELAESLIEPLKVLVKKHG